MVKNNLNIRNAIKEALQEAVKQKTYYWLDSDLFIIEFEGGVDKENDEYSHQAQCSVKDNEWIFSRWYEYDITNTDFTEQEKEYIKMVVKDLIKG